MPLTSKSTRELESLAKTSQDEFDFGEPEIIAVEIYPGRFIPASFFLSKNRMPTN
jgi:hypothetical protein